ncbi:GSCOCG00001417001-RA-CDS [Cotesia congregata]|nr:GSCOCG00001417001-RA-CDS [Cotesia congregata]
MMTVFQELYYDGTLTDVTIGLSDGLLVECHKLVLAACSPYFKKILQNMNRPRALILVNVKYYQMKALLRFMYHGEVTISSEEMPELLQIANYLKIKGLVEGADIPDSSLRSSSPIEQTQHPLEHSQSEEHHQQRRSRRDRHASPSPPPISSSHPNYLASMDRNESVDHIYDERFSGVPAWNLPFGPHFAASLNGSSVSAHHSQLFPAPYDDMAICKSKMQNLNMGRDTPILRTVLGQGNADSSQAASLLHPDNQEYRSPSSRSAGEHTDNKRNGSSGSQNISPYDPAARDTDKKTNLDSFFGFKSWEKNFGSYFWIKFQFYLFLIYIFLKRVRANGDSHREWKRYKQYTKEHINSAIQAVRDGMSALQAARRFGVPSRTLYDKVKKMGIANSRSMRRSGNNNNNNSGASFPYGIGCNKNGRIYASHSENDYENNSGVSETPDTVIEPSYEKSRENSVDRESTMELSRVTPSSSPNQSVHSARLPEAEEDQDQVEDLSMSSKKSDIRVIVSPVIKEEKVDPDNFNK